MDKGSGSAFDDLVDDDDEDVEESAAQPVSVSKSAESSTTESSHEGAGTSPRRSDDSQRTATPDRGPSLEESSPPFSWHDAGQDSMYPRQETWDKIDDFEYDIQGLLRSEYGIRNAETRELHEAMFQLLLDRIPPEVVARKVIEQRGFSPD